MSKEQAVDLNQIKTEDGLKVKNINKEKQF